MDTHFIFEQVRKMRPSSFSEKERHCYLAEKMMLRQFLLMKHQDQLPDYLTVRHMKTWLLTRRSFLEEFQEIIERTEIDHLFMAELAWTTARHFCLHQMEAELLEELDKEKRLSQLLGRIVTLEGLQMFVSLIHTAAEEDVQTFLQSLNKKLLKIFSGIEIKGGLVSAGDTKPAEISQLEQSTAPLVPKVVDIALKFLLEEPQHENKREAASAEIGKLLANSAAPCLSLAGNMSKTLLLRLCTMYARYMVKAIYERFDKSSKSFHLMDYDDSYHTAKEGTIFAIQDMGYEVQSDAFSQAHLQLEDGLLEESEVSPEVTLDEEIDTTSNDVTEDNTEATLAQYSAVQNMDHEVQNNTSSQDHLQLKDGLLEESGASPGVYLNEDCDTLPNDVTEDKTEESLVQDSAVQDMDMEVQCDASSQAHILLEEGLLEESGASPEVASTEELEKELQNTDTLPNDVTEDKTEESLVQDSAIQDMDFEVQSDASSQAHLQLEEEGPIEEREASPLVSLEKVATTVSPPDGSEDTSSAKLETRESSPKVIQDTHALRLESNVIVYMDDELEELQEEEVTGVGSFFCGLWKMVTCCFCVSTEK